MNNVTHLNFGTTIKFEDVHIYSRKFNDIKTDVVLDMSQIIEIHSAMIGLLVVAAQRLQAQNCKMTLKASPHLDQCIRYLGLNIFSSDQIITAA